MAYYPTDKELEDSCKVLRLHSRCAECGGKLALRYDMDAHKDYLVCSENESHEGLRKKRPENLKQTRREISMDSVALTKLGEPGMMQRIEMARFPQALKPEEKAMLATVALSYGLDPIMNELTIYQGRPYPTVNAWYRKSQETGLFDGMDSRPANEQERKERNAVEGDLLYRCEVWRRGASHPFVGWGRVRAEERKGSPHLPIVKESDRMAEKRAEMMAMRKAFSIPMPSITWEEAVEADITVDKGTGEIIEGEVKEVSPTDSGLDINPPNTDSPDLTPVTPEQIANIRELLKVSGKTAVDLGKFMNEEKAWGISVPAEDLKKWQYDIIILECLKIGLEEY